MLRGYLVCGGISFYPHARPGAEGGPTSSSGLRVQGCQCTTWAATPTADRAFRFIFFEFSFLWGIDQATRVQGQYLRSAQATSEMSSFGELPAQDLTTPVLTLGSEKRGEPGHGEDQALGMTANFINRPFGWVSLRGVARVSVHCHGLEAVRCWPLELGGNEFRGARTESAWDSTGDRTQAGQHPKRSGWIDPFSAQLDTNSPPVPQRRGRSSEA